MPRNQVILVSFRFGTQSWKDMPFPAAVVTIEKSLNAEQNAFIDLRTQIDTDQWIAAYWSELLGMAEPPSDKEWSAAQISLGRARNAYDSGRDEGAKQALTRSVDAFNAVHRKFWTYRDAVSEGGETAITTMQITNMVLGAAFSAGVGVMGASLFSGAAASAGLTLAQTTAYNAMMIHIGAQQKFDIADIVLQTAASFVSSLLSGALCGKFATLVGRRFVAKLYNVPGLQKMTFDEIARWAAQTGVALPVAMKSPQEFLSGLFASFGADRLLDVVTGVAKANKGKLMKAESFMEQIAEKALLAVGQAPQPQRL